jgi:hypothetical protein
MIHFPYGNSDFHKIRTGKMLYLDRTHMIPDLEQAGGQLLFLRPRRFGKSLLLSMLSHYYDINRVGEFSALFGDLAIGQAPTPEHNRYLILHWDFSVVSPMGDVDGITIKSGAGRQGIGRVFITGVSPVVMSDITSGYNVATNIYLEPDFNALCGIGQQELETLVAQVLTECQQDNATQAEVLEILRLFYNGYRFCTDIRQPCVYNPTLVFYFLQHYQKVCSAPEQVLDSNLAMDAGKIRYIASLSGGKAVIAQILDEQKPLAITSLENRFGVEALREMHQGQRFMGSLLYYFGVLTLTGRSPIGGLELNAPNLVIRGLYLEELQRNVLPNAQDADTARTLAEAFYQTADLQPLVEFMEQKN